MLPETKSVPDIALCRIGVQPLPVPMPTVKCQRQIRAYLGEWKFASGSV